ncbi:hypothetical protein [Rhizosphaericola mali]|uniref:Uncharacterized protein n=1 Tax=Rhizosphaericola mali TaxID=2545455 RepID=A0A5P2G9T7_9BACT|nr:hypothetical protein [Rhizosphaericola mali]QES91069.1 hypothetical protein E0W69_020360 [Rhizosphaericola mali]
MNKLQEKDNGKLQGGFASIKGGSNSTDISTEDVSTNVSWCTNSGDCTKTTNSTRPGCSNTGTCFF